MYKAPSLPSATPQTSSRDTAKTFSNAKTAPFSETTIHYIEEAVSRGASIDSLSVRDDCSESSASKQRKPAAGTGSTGVVAAPGMYVQALYNYEADDRTSLSFRQGDIIQVITQLESGWWDGVINGVRGWFPSNYCALVTGPDDGRGDGRGNGENGEGTGEMDEGEEEDSEDQYEYDDDEEEEVNDDPSPGLPLEGTEKTDLEEAAFWVPQATPDGRLFYFNTQTGVSTMELPLETPTSTTETGPPDRMNVRVPEQTRPPPEMMVGGYERDEDALDGEETTSVSERDLDQATTDSRGQRGVCSKGYASMTVVSIADSIYRFRRRVQTCPTGYHLQPRWIPWACPL